MKKKVILFVVIVVALLGVATTAFVVGMNSNKNETETEETSAGIEYESGDGVVYMNKDADLSGVKRVKGVVNVYMFWGAGCPHCKAQWEWLDSLREKYEGKIAIYGFEVFNNSRNRTLMDIFANTVGDKDVSSVPYTVIGDKSVGGFTNGASTGKKIRDLIEEAAKSEKDIYFDKIK